MDRGTSASRDIEDSGNVKKRGKKKTICGKKPRQNTRKTLKSPKNAKRDPHVIQGGFDVAEGGSGTARK